MSVSINEFMRKYEKALVEDYAAIFAGAGLSRSSGFVNWKELLHDLASDINLDVHKENDLVSVAQYYCNERGNRTEINQTIMDKFLEKTKYNSSIDCIARLPIKTFWTTNYDTLIEDALRNKGKKVDVKIHQSNLSITLSKRDTVVYKMHGDVTDPCNAVITKDDYESYSLTRDLFSMSLQGDLVSKTFLFIGFSFSDPNLSYILSRIRLLLGKNQRTHYCFIRKVNADCFSSPEDYNYAKIKQTLQINDLKRYSIKAVMVDSYNQISDILVLLEKRYLANYIFVSGSAEVYGVKWENEAEIFLNDLAKELIKKNLRIVTGIGHGVGSFILSGALSEIMNNQNMSIEKFLDLRPFPYQDAPSIKLNELKTKYRKGMISKSGVCIFLFGNKKNKNTLVDSDGMWEEFLIAQELHRYIIPVASTGYLASKIMDYVIDNSEKFSYLTNELDILMKSFDKEVLISCIMRIITEIKNHT